MEREQRCYFRDSFRDARAEVTDDAEASGNLIFALERFGAILTPEARGLFKKGPNVFRFAALHCSQPGCLNAGPSTTLNSKLFTINFAWLATMRYTKALSRVTWRAML